MGVVKTEKRGGEGETLTGSRIQTSVFIIPVVDFSASPMLLAKLHL